MTSLEIYEINTNIDMRIKAIIKEFVVDLMKYFNEDFNEGYYLPVEKWIISKKIIRADELNKFKWTIISNHPRQYKTSPGIFELDAYYEKHCIEREKMNTNKAIKDASRLIAEETVTAEQVHEALEGITKAWKSKEKI